jgi:hypothetical protein
LTDGSANTIVFGELLGGSSPGNRDYSVSWMSPNHVTAWGVGPGNPTAWYHFGSSKHTGITNFGLGDGSVRVIRNGVGTTFFDVPWYNYNRFAAGNDGQVIEYDSIGG